MTKEQFLAEELRKLAEYVENEVNKTAFSGLFAEPTTAEAEIQLAVSRMLSAAKQFEA